MSRRWILAAFVVLGAACSSSSDVDVQQTAAPVTTAVAATPKATVDPSYAAGAAESAAVVADELAATGMVSDAEVDCIERTLTDRWANDPTASRRLASDRKLAQAQVAAAMGTCIDMRAFGYATFVDTGLSEATARCIVDTARESDLRTVILSGAGADPASILIPVAEAQARLAAVTAGCR